MVGFNTKVDDVKTKSDNYTQLHGHGDGASALTVADAELGL